MLEIYKILNAAINIQQKEDGQKNENIISDEGTYVHWFCLHSIHVASQNIYIIYFTCDTQDLDDYEEHDFGNNEDLEIYEGI